MYVMQTWPVTLVAKRSSISVAAELLLLFPVCFTRRGLVLSLSRVLIFCSVIHLLSMCVFYDHNLATVE